MRYSRMAPVILMLAVVPLAQGEPIRLQMKFPKGRVEKMVVTQNLDQTLTGKALPAPVKQYQKQTMDVTVKVAESDAKGALVEMTYSRIRASSNLSGRATTYDSAKDRAKKDPQAMAYSALLGAQLKLRFGPDGKIQQVQGMNEVWDKLAKQVPGGGLVIDQFKKGMGDDALKQMISQWLTGFLPDKAVSIGDTWSADQTQNLAGLGKLKLKMNFKYGGLEDRSGRKLAKIPFTSSGTLEGTFGVPNFSLKATSITQTGTIFFDIERGWVSDQSILQQMKGVANVKTPNGQQIKLNIAQTMKISVKVGEK